MDTLNILKNALKNDELKEFLKGDKYSLKLPYMVPSDAPTDWLEILKNGVYKLYEEDVSVKTKIEKTLETLFDSREGIYAVINILYAQLIIEKDGRSPFVMNKDRIIELVKIYLPQYKEELKKDFRWDGHNEEDGLWGDLERICRLMNSKYGVRIID